MSVKIIIPWTMAHITNDVKEVEADGSTVSECLDQVIGLFPRLKKELLRKEGELRPDILIYVNDETTYPDPLARTVKDGDELNITILIAGG